MESGQAAYIAAGVIGAITLTGALFLKYQNSVGIFDPLVTQIFGIGKLAYPISGHVEKGYERVKDAFEQNFAAGLEIGSGLVVYVKGEKVVELYGGFEDLKTKKPYTDQTLHLVFSCGKAVESIIFAHLVTLGLVDYHQRVSHYWPEFAQGGKQDVKLCDLLGHRGGVAWLDPENTPTAEEVHDLDVLATKIARQKHNYDGKPIQAYHALSRGWYLNEIVRRVDPKHRSMGQIVTEDIAPRLGVEFFYGLPAEYENRVCRMVPYPALRGLGNIFIPRFLLRDPPHPRLYDIARNPNHPTRKTFSAVPYPNGKVDRDWANARVTRTGGATSYGAVTNCLGLARFALVMASGGTVDHFTIVSPEAYKKSQELLVPMQVDQVLGLERQMTVGGYAVDIGRETINLKSSGWGGAGGSVIVWNREKQIAVGYCMNAMHGREFAALERTQRLLNAIAACTE
ncbi:hypothetical protein SmJEL517_g01438 [Synchytrium microbalum]|uniref:Beta-lactamase-related domain-containing protein n=1 Tax=Synchytrium microbalum TaxID=1806994 RepID=A0A507CAH3_9FUNG|nr:uncharacterized protein SmJEL517_g01438 [Synchytrium microbalum]TPX36169.1 hypothetical protein SmJEL517_g01438 [Synchytrium microbalum]